MIQKEFQNYFIHYRAWYLKVKDVLEKTGAKKVNLMILYFIGIIIIDLTA